MEEELRLNAVPARVAAWHNRHPLAHRVEPSQVRAVGYVALPFGMAPGQGGGAAAAPAVDVGTAAAGADATGTLRERALARSRGQGDTAFAAAAATAAANATAAAAAAVSPAAGARPDAAAGAAPSSTARTTAALVPAFIENFIAPLRPADVARWAARHGRLLPRPPGGAPVRTVAAGALPAGLRPATLYVLTAAIEAGGHRSRVLVGGGDVPAVFGRRLWSRARLAAASALGGAGIAAAVAVLAWPEVPGPQQVAVPASAAAEPAASAAQDPAVVVAAAVKAAPAAAPGATPAVPGDAVGSASADVSVATTPAAAPSAPSAPAATAAPAAAARPTAPPGAAAPAATGALPDATGSATPERRSASAAGLNPRLQPQLAARPAVPPRVELTPPLSEAAKDDARRELEAARAAVRGGPVTRTRSAAPPPVAPAAASAATAGVATVAPAVTGTPRAANPSAPPAAAPLPSPTAPPAAEPRAPGMASTFAVSTRPLRTRAEADQVRAAMDALLRGTRPATPPDGLRVEVLAQGDDWRVVGWPYARRGEADQARSLLVARGLRVEVIAY